MGQPSGDFSEIVTGMVMEDDHLRQYQQLLFREMNGDIITLYRGWTRALFIGRCVRSAKDNGIDSKRDGW